MTSKIPNSWQNIFIQTIERQCWIKSRISDFVYVRAESQISLEIFTKPFDFFINFKTCNILPFS
jgi:hypothetical protein